MLIDRENADFIRDPNFIDDTQLINQVSDILSSLREKIFDTLVDWNKKDE